MLIGVMKDGLRNVDKKHVSFQKNISKIAEIRKKLLPTVSLPTVSHFFQGKKLNKIMQ